MKGREVWDREDRDSLPRLSLGTRLTHITLPYPPCRPRPTACTPRLASPRLRCLFPSFPLISASSSPPHLPHRARGHVAPSSSWLSGITRYTSDGYRRSRVHPAPPSLALRVWQPLAVHGVGATCRPTTSGDACLGQLVRPGRRRRANQNRRPTLVPQTRPCPRGLRPCRVTAAFGICGFLFGLGANATAVTRPLPTSS
jgi:hypothetical protein